MGIVSSRPEEGPALFLRDQHRLSISSVGINSPRKRSSVNIVPNAFPASRISASRGPGEVTPIEFVQDVDTSSSGPSFLLKLTNEDELVFNFTFVVRQPATTLQSVGQSGNQPTLEDTQINGLTFVYAPTGREVENLVTREFHADPNLHKNSNVELVGDFSTGGSSSVTFEWSWKWKPPRNSEDKGGGWRNCCSFVEYDQRAHRLDTLASFTFWVANTSALLSHPSSPSPPFLLHAPPKTRVVSSHSVDSRMSAAEQDEPSSPVTLIPDTSSTTTSTTVAPTLKESVKVDVSCPRPGDDMAVADDGPVFRATIKALELKTGSMRMQMKRVIKKAEHAHATQAEANEAFVGFLEALKEAASTNANAVQPAIDHYFDKIARDILSYERQNATNLQKIIIDPMHRLYAMDIKQAESKKRDFEDESKDYYAYVARYLGQRSDSVRTKKLADSDSKYQNKRRTFELKRFDYSSFMQDLSGGRKEQEVLSHLTKYADAQAKAFLATSKKVEALLPQLEALTSEVQGADKDYQYQRREREEKRRVLEKSNAYKEPDTAPVPPSTSAGTASNGNQSNSDSELGRADSTGSTLRNAPTSRSNGAGSNMAGDLARSPGSLSHHASVGSPPQSSKFRGIRDLEERDASQVGIQEKNATQRKEGLLWALNRPGGHVDPRALNKQGWHKFWIVLDQGKLSEYSNWKQKLDLHMDPIDLRMASVREARNAERRFCFEVITPQFKRVYQATSEDDMNSWITSINNALQSAVEGRPFKDKPSPAPATASDSAFKRDIGSILTGKSSSLTHGSGSAGAGIPSRRTTVGARPSGQRTSSSTTLGDSPDKLLQTLRDHDQGNTWCADCGTGSKVEWVSINLAIILCIECSGIHRSLGTHISKVRSLTLDIKSFTPDIVELLLLVGNRVANMVWEAKMDPAHKLAAQATREQRLKFIRAKYEERAYVEPISATLSRYATADETLMAGIKRNEIQLVIYALSLGANPNLTDKSRGTHSVYLALAAADPAAPSGVSTTAAVSAAVESGATADKRVSFPVAEVLLQNGAEVPATMPGFPLSRSAQLYLETKRGRTIPGPSHPGGTSGGSLQDAVGSLPTGSSTGLLPGSSGSERLVNRDREAWLQKRASAGGRLAKSPIPER